ncbi:MAG: hypothetical protein HZR80_13955 [Candidatus Heimdallarchaeota archaeon]
MLVECYLVDEEGGENKVEPSELKITHKTLLIIVHHDDHYIYVFKGANVSIVQKFASARRASGMRLQHGYKIRHIEEAEGMTEADLELLAHFGGIIDDAGAPVKVAKEKAVPAKPKTPKAPPMKTFAAKKTTTTTTKKPAAVKVKTKAIALEDLPPKLSKVVKTMMSLEPPEGSSCDYILAGTKLYIILGENKTDLRKGHFKLEEISTLPEGVFPAENYYPRILVANQKVLGVELWARR